MTWEWDRSIRAKRRSEKRRGGELKRDKTTQPTPKVYFKYTDHETPPSSQQTTNNNNKKYIFSLSRDNTTFPSLPFPSSPPTPPHRTFSLFLPFSFFNRTIPNHTQPNLVSYDIINEKNEKWKWNWNWIKIKMKRRS